MQRSNFSARLAALATGVALIVSCDSRLPTQPGTGGGTGGGGGASGDVELPTVKVTLASGALDSVLYLGSALGVSIAATDNKGVSSIATTLRNTGTGTSSLADTITYATPLASATRAFTLASTAVRRGDRVVIRATALDLAGNTRVDSVIATVADTAPPQVTVTSTFTGNRLTNGATVVGGDSMYVRVVGADSAGIDSTGYRLLYLRTPTDTVVVFSQIRKPGTRTNSFTFDAPFIISDTLPIGPYVLQGFAGDLSGLAARRNSNVSFTLTDGQAPRITVLNPAASSRIAVGDSILFRARLQDNSGVKSVTVEGFSPRGDPSLGTADTARRYPLIVAPATGSFPATRDTIISRYLKVGPTDAILDTIVILRAKVTDASNNTTTVLVPLQLVPTISITANTAGRALKVRDTVQVTVTAGDTTGVAAVGYRLYRVRPTDSVLVSSDSVLVPAGTFVKTNVFRLVLPDTLTPASYTLRGFARVSSPLAMRTALGPGFSVGDILPPAITFTSPIEPYRLTVNDSLPVSVHITDNVSLAKVVFRAFSVRGSAALGTVDTVTRYTTVTVPATGTFHGTRDTIITRILHAAVPPDSLNDTLIVVGTVTDSSGFSSSAQVRIQLTNGPRVRIISPVPGDSLTAGSTFIFTINATSDFGTTAMSARLKSDPSWPTPIDTVIQLPFVAPSNNVTVTGRIVIPLNAPKKSTLTLTPTAVDVAGQPGSSAPFVIAVRDGTAPAPLVRQTVAPRLEISDSILVTATGDRVSAVGYQLRNRAGATIATYSTLPTTIPQWLPLSLGAQYQGQRLAVVSFARDSAGRTGWSVAASVNIPQTDSASAKVDSTDIVYGQTYGLPAARFGVARDITVDGTRGNVFISNTQYNRLERWSAATRTFDAVGVAVGSEPWGMVMQSDNDTLLVANSGGTNISKVCINPASCGGSIGEVLSKRIQTRNTFVYTVTEIRDQATGKIHFVVVGPISYSDRPQYVQQSAGGRLFYSTKPTSTAPAGTIRWLDPKLPVPDPRQVYQYAEGGTTATYAVFNTDSVKVALAPANSPASDVLFIYDHPYGQASGSLVGSGTTLFDAVNGVNAGGGDVEARNDIDVNLLPLTDTTFVTSSGDRTWIGFGEGNTGGGVGRIMMINDPVGPMPGYFSPAVTVRDILDNASEPVFGLGMDLHGSQVAVHGRQSYFAALEDPFHLRLQGKYDSFDQGAGIVFHPNADLRSTAISSSRTDSTRTAFVASANGSIEVVDAAFFISRGRLQIKNNLYGPIRATLPFASDNVGLLPSDPNYIVLKLFGLTSTGLVVINLRASDIAPVP